MRSGGGLGRRLDRLAARLGADAACRACRGWSPTAVCDLVGRCTRPEVCPACGRRVPILLRRIIVRVDLDKV